MYRNIDFIRIDLCFLELSLYFIELNVVGAADAAASQNFNSRKTISLERRTTFSVQNVEMKLLQSVFLFIEEKRTK